MSEEKVEYNADGWKTDSRSKDSVDVEQLIEIGSVEPKTLKLFTPTEVRALTAGPPKTYSIDWDKVRLEEVKTILKHLYNYAGDLKVMGDTKAYDELKHVLIHPTED